MNATQNEARRAPRDVFYEFSLAANPPTADLLEAFIRRYPDHAEALTDFAVDLMVEALHPRGIDERAPATAKIDEAVSKAMSHVLNRIYEIDQARAGPAPVRAENLIEKLTRDEMRRVGEQLHANTAFVMMLRDREIDVGSTTMGFRQRLADVLCVPADAIYAHLAAPRRMPQAMRFIANAKPTATTKVPFVEAVRKCGLSEDQIAHLLKL